MSLEQASALRAGDHRFDGSLLLFAAGKNAHPGDLSTLSSRSKVDKLIILFTTESQVKQATRSDAVRPIECAHVCPPQWRVLGHKSNDLVVSEHEITANAVGFFALWQLVFIAISDFKRFRSADDG